MTRQIAIVAVIFFACGCSKTDYDKMHSFWTVTSAESAGKPDDTFKNKDVFVDSEILIGGLAAIDFFWTDPPRHKLLLDSGKSPKQLTVDNWQGIYELKGDDLKICLNMDGKTRPTEFKTKEGEDSLLLVMKRKKL